MSDHLGGVRPSTESKFATATVELLWLTAFEKQLPKELSLVSDSAEEIY